MELLLVASLDYLMAGCSETSWVASKADLKDQYSEHPMAHSSVDRKAMRLADSTAG